MFFFVLMFNQRVYSSRSTPRADTTRCWLQSQLDYYWLIDSAQHALHAVARRRWLSLHYRWINDVHAVCNCHSLANKTVVQLRPKSTTGSSFLLEYNRDFCRRYDTSPPNFSVSRFCASCLCPFMLKISLFLLHKGFRLCRYWHIFVILVIPYAWRLW